MKLYISILLLALTSCSIRPKPEIYFALNNDNIPSIGYLHRVASNYTKHSKVLVAVMLLESDSFTNGFCQATNNYTRMIVPNRRNFYGNNYLEYPSKYYARYDSWVFCVEDFAEYIKDVIKRRGRPFISDKELISYLAKEYNLKYAPQEYEERLKKIISITDFKSL